MFQLVKRRLAIRSYRKKLGPYLEQKFGWRLNYSPLEIRSGATALGLSMIDLCYAYAMYCTPAEFTSHHAAIGESCDYAAMLAETLSFGTGSHGDSSSHHDSGGGGWADSHGHDHGGHHGGHGDSSSHHDSGGRGNSHGHDHGSHDFGGHDSGGGHDGGGHGGSDW